MRHHSRGRPRRHPPGRPQGLSPSAEAQRFADVFTHAQKRAWQHYGLDLTMELFRAWSDAIRAGNARYVAPARTGGHVWGIQHGELELFAIHRDDLIRTFLPARAEELRLAEEAHLRDLLEPLDELDDEG